jgi:hypothetical protein
MKQIILAAALMLAAATASQAQSAWAPDADSCVAV